MPGYTLPDGITVKNKVGATSHAELERLEGSFVRQRFLEVKMGSVSSGSFDADHLKEIHKHLFQDVYEWAGRTRNERISLSDGTIATEPILMKAGGRPFIHSSDIPKALATTTAKLKESDYLRGMDRKGFSEKAADVLIELNAVHPFREGNGRTQRVFIEQLAKAAGHELDFTVVTRARMYEASVESFERNDPAMMLRMFDEISTPERVSLLREGLIKLQNRLNTDSQASGKPPLLNLNEQYVATAAPGHQMELTLVGIAGNQFMARTQAQIIFGFVADLPDPVPKSGEIFRFVAKS
jgi:cell filamentation protein